MEQVNLRDWWILALEMLGDQCPVTIGIGQMERLSVGSLDLKEFLLPQIQEHLVQFIGEDGFKMLIVVVRNKVS